MHRLDDLERAEQRRPEHVRGERPEREEAHARVQLEREEVARERPGVREEQRRGRLVPEARGHAEVGGVRGEVDEDGEDGERVARGARGRGRGGEGEARFEERGEVVPEGDG